MVCLLIILAYCIIGLVFWANTQNEFEMNERKPWMALSMIIWPVLMHYYLNGSITGK